MNPLVPSLVIAIEGLTCPLVIFPIPWTRLKCLKLLRNRTFYEFSDSFSSVLKVEFLLFTNHFSTVIENPHFPMFTEAWSMTELDSKPFIVYWSIFLFAVICLHTNQKCTSLLLTCVFIRHFNGCFLHISIDKCWWLQVSKVCGTDHSNFATAVVRNDW